MKRHQLFCSGVRTALQPVLMFFTRRNHRLHIDPPQADGKIRSRVLFLALAACALLLSAAGAEAATFTVNSPADVPDVKPGDGICETAPGNGVCTLRAAIQEANMLPGPDTIILQPNTTYTLTRAGTNEGKSLNGDLNILDSVTIVGAGPNSTIIDGNGSATGERVLTVSNCIDNGTLPGTSPTPSPTPPVCNANDANDPKVIKASISGITIENGKSTNFGGGLINNGNLTLINVTITKNTVSGVNDWGGGIYSSGPLTINNCTIADNISGTHNAYGGGICNNGAMMITNSTISGNITSGSVGYGGGIYTSGATATIKNSTISGNTATNGGGIFKAGFPVVVINSTISGNFSNVNGGGIFAGSGTIGLFNVTVTGNKANSDGTGTGIGGGVNADSGSTLNFQNSIIAGNFNVTDTGGPFDILNNDDCAGTISSLTNNIMHDVNTSYCTVTGPVTMADPNLGPLQNNGGLTFTHALLSGSPAIDAGNSSGCTDDVGAFITTDQRGLHRPEGTRCDVGAFEAQLGALANVSTRLRVETGDNVLIGGFIVTGTQSKKVIVLAVGPSLNLADKLADPTLDLYQGNTLLDSNDNWVDSPNKQAIIDSGVAPTNNLESAIVRTLPANNSQYTAIVRGVNNTTGIGVVQAYDLDRSVDSKLANISTRGLVQTGDDVLIAGTIVVGETSRKVIVRAIGPSLNVPGKLADPMLELHDGNGMLLDSNDNWKDSPNKQAIIDSGVPPTNDLESAIVATLPPSSGGYTAIVRGVGGTTGVAVVDVFALN
jgi:CSLREA domain-containing protein